MIRLLQVMLALGIAGLIGTTMVVGWTAGKPESAISDATPLPRSNAAATAELTKTSTVAVLEPANSRNVGGGVVAVPLSGEGPLERVAALPQPTPPIASKVEPVLPEKQFLRWRLVFNAIATSAGILQIGDTALVFPGIDVVSVDETCTTPAGGSWPCGMVARTAFRNYLQGRALNCHLPDGVREKAILAECLLLGQDPAAWLVERGWARSSPDSPLASIGEEAKSSSRGIYGQPPYGVEVKSP